MFFGRAAVRDERMERSLPEATSRPLRPQGAQGSTMLICGCARQHVSDQKSGLGQTQNLKLKKESNFQKFSASVRKTVGFNQLHFHRKKVFAYHPLVSVFSDPRNVVRMAVAACLWPTTSTIPSVH